MGMLALMPFLVLTERFPIRILMAAERPATTEQSVVTSCTRSHVSTRALKKVLSGSTSTLEVSLAAVSDPSKSSFGRFHPANVSPWVGERVKTASSLTSNKQ